MKSKILIEKQLKKKNNLDLVETIISAKKNKNWFEIAHILSSPRRNLINVNLDKISNNLEKNETLVIPGKVLSQGKIDKKGIIVAFKFSEKAKDKLIKAGCEVRNIADEIKNNPDAKGVKILSEGLKNPTLPKTKEAFNK